MKALIIVYSYHHMNTEKVAKAMAKVLDAEVKTPEQVDLDTLQNYELIGFGAGIDSAHHYAPILELADKLHVVQDKSAFIFSTSAIISDNKVAQDHAALREKLVAKGYSILDEFACKGYNTNSFLKYVGGMNKGRPNAQDLKNAKEFAGKLSVLL